MQVLDARLAQGDVWNDPEQAAQLNRNRSEITTNLTQSQQVQRALDDGQAMIELDAEGGELDAEFEQHLSALETALSDVEVRLMLSGEHDHRNAIVEIHPGAGGLEAQDWADMLLRMYVRWAERRGFTAELLDRLDGDGAGIKSATLRLVGSDAYGWLKSERGVHRLVRISPFDAQARRQTSFAAVDVIPEVEDDIKIEILDKDLRIDTFRSSGAGGQHVNVTDSAVRITHAPSGIVVTCQDERSQIKNRDKAMKVLRARLYEKALREREEQQAKEQGTKMGINFGSQIRSYVLAPYRLVKDHRTDFEVGDADRVLDGDLNGFMKAWLLERAQA